MILLWMVDLRVKTETGQETQLLKDVQVEICEHLGPMGKASTRFQRSSSAIQVFWRSRADARYAPPEADRARHPRGLIKQVVGEAIQKLGAPANR